MMNPKAGQGDGAGFGRLRAAQAMRAAFMVEIERTHPSCAIFIDKVHEYAGVQICMYRTKSKTFEHARVAVFQHADGRWHKCNDIIANIGDNS
jgi:hypothetical protein